MISTDLDALEAAIRSLVSDDPDKTLAQYARDITTVAEGTTALIAEVRRLRAEVAELREPLPVIRGEA